MIALYTSIVKYTEVKQKHNPFLWCDIDYTFIILFILQDSILLQSHSHWS